MTQRVRTGYRNHRRASWFVALALGVGAVLASLALVLPALGAGAQIPPASDQGVIPTDVPVGGSNFSCTTNTGNLPTGMSSYQVTNPPNSAAQVNYNLGGGVTLSLTGFNQGNLKGKYFNFTMSGANVFHVGVKGGNDVAWYDYYDNAATSGGVQTDGHLHATLSSSGLYNASITTFCYAKTTTISGKVFLDNNADGSFNTSSTPPDVGQNGWTVELLTSAGVQVGSSLTTPSPNSDPAGSYTFTGVPIGGSYKVCVMPPANSGTWDQTPPTPIGTWSSNACSTVTGALPSGRVISNLPATGAAGQDFGDEQTVTPNCGGTFGPAPGTETAGDIVEYTAQFTNPPPATKPCKDAVVMYSYLDQNSSTPYAIIHPTAGAGSNTFWVVERIRMLVSGAKLGQQNPVTIGYDDTEPYGDNGYPAMKMCKSDPRATGSDFALATDPESPTVMPTGETSCMIVTTVYSNGGVTDGSVTYNYEAYIATDVDGIKQPT